MKIITNSTTRTGWFAVAFAGGALLWLLAGCAHHRERVYCRERFLRTAQRVWPVGNRRVVRALLDSESRGSRLAAVLQWRLAQHGCRLVLGK
jgi:hypothetical protein